MRTGYGGSSLRPDDFSLSVYARFVLCGARAGDRASGSACGSPRAERHQAERIESLGKGPDFAAVSSVLVVTLEHGIPLIELARVQDHPPMLIRLIPSF
jgi:RNA-splicing ligase RtcB